MSRRRDCLLAALALAPGLRPSQAQAPASTSTPSPAPKAAGLAELPGYQRLDPLSGTLKAVGSSTVAAVLKPAADLFESLQAGVSLDIGGGGSSTATAGMLDHVDTLGLLSRPMTAREREALRARHGGEPLALRIAVDALAIYVYKSNPVRSLSLDELRRAFGRGPDAAHHWGELGLGGDWARVPLERYGIERGRGANDLMREVVLGGDEFSSDVNVEPVVTSVVQGVATEPGGIGYGSVYFRTLRTRVLPIRRGDELVEPSAENALSGRYPLARYLYVCVNRAPGRPLPVLTRQFLQFILSREGQELVARQGLFPLNAQATSEALAALSR